jgi:hypothetical protein
MSSPASRSVVALKATVRQADRKERKESMREIGARPELLCVRSHSALHGLFFHGSATRGTPCVARVTNREGCAGSDSTPTRRCVGEGSARAALGARRGRNAPRFRRHRSATARLCSRRTRGRHRSPRSASVLSPSSTSSFYRVLGQAGDRRRDLVIAMIVSRLIAPGSKLATARGLDPATAARCCAWARSTKTSSTTPWIGCSNDSRRSRGPLPGSASPTAYWSSTTSPRARQIVEQHLESGVEQVPPAPCQMFEHCLLMRQQPVVTAIERIDLAKAGV